MEARQRIKKILRKLKKIFGPALNMHTHPAERYYFEQYYRVLCNTLPSRSKILDIGCQYGRFTIPLANGGHTVTATDITERYFGYILKHLKDPASVTLRKESVEDTLRNLDGKQFDAVLCLELLYNLPDPATLMKGMKKLLAPGGVLIASHRSPGYYAYRFLKENNPGAVRAILEGTHPDYNAVSLEKLLRLYGDMGFKVLNTVGIGSFSGFWNDPFAAVADPSKMTPEQLKELSLLENDAVLNTMFINSARYILVVAKQV